jgi:MoaA/NifB/PqqE/SkfB family radical SAM enzyme
MASETFCVLPWVHAATLTDGNVQLCCVAGRGSGVNLNEQTLSEYWNSEHVRDARRRMLAGRKVKACQRCYLTAPLQSIDLRLGNTCNMQCVMCQPRESSRWLPTARRLSELVEGRELKGVWDFKSPSMPVVSSGTATPPSGRT